MLDWCVFTTSNVMPVISETMMIGNPNERSESVQCDSAPATTTTTTTTTTACTELAMNESPREGEERNNRNNTWNVSVIPSDEQREAFKKSDSNNNGNGLCNL